MKVSLRDITKANWRKIANLKVADEQRQYVADNVYSIAEDAYSDHSFARAIYAGEKPVGFIMYESLDNEGKPGDYKINRFMIDQRHQSSGLGRLAMAQAIAEISAIFGAKKIAICYVPGNAVAKDFYSSIGFKEVGPDEHGEMIAEIML